jgi:hypothetical protein
MGKLFVLGIAIAVGYTFGYRDARAHSQDILTRTVVQIRTTFGGKELNNVDAVMTKIEDKN